MIYILHATHTRFGYEHKFIEVFSSAKKLNSYVASHTDITVVERTMHEVDPV